MESWRTHNPATGTASYLHESNWALHAAKRPEIRDHLFSVRETVSAPDFAVTRGPTVYKYRGGYGHGKTKDLWLVVIEEPDPSGAHFVKTAYFTADVVQGTLWLGNFRIGGR